MVFTVIQAGLTCSVFALLCPQEKSDHPHIAFFSGRSVGEKITISIEASMELDLITRDVEGDGPARHIHVSRQEKFVEEVMEIADGRAIKLKVTCSASTLQRSSSGSASSTKESSPVEGKTFIVDCGSLPAKVTREDGSPAPAEALFLGGWENCLDLLPGRGLKPGEEWKVSGKKIITLALASKIVEPQGELSCTMPDGSQPRIAFTGEVRGKTGESFSIRLEVIKGELVWDPEKKQPRSVEISGTLELAQDIIYRDRRLGQLLDEERKVGEIRGKSQRFDLRILFQPVE